MYILQRNYVLDLLQETWMLECRPAESPMEFNFQIGCEEKSLSTNKERLLKIGCIFPYIIKLL